MKKIFFSIVLVFALCGAVRAAATPDWALDWVSSLVPFHGMTYAILQHPQVIVTLDKDEPNGKVWRLITTDMQNMPGQTLISLAHVAAPGAKPLGAMVTDPIAGMPSYYLKSDGLSHSFYVSCKDRHFIINHVAGGSKMHPIFLPFETLSEKIFIEFVNKMGNFQGELKPGK